MLGKHDKNRFSVFINPLKEILHIRRLNFPFISIKRHESFEVHHQFKGEDDSGVFYLLHLNYE